MPGELKRMQTIVEQNNRPFYMHITEGNEISEILPGYRCHSDSKFSDIEIAPSYAIISLYQQLFR
ncbi:3545_t:CDS:2 [Funneliformis caledonium]|uniref:3545_t:CDS:1 n=1 Tax=Funneliformis caledonium TaxID=1117310 RepID=A0A9N8YRD6_9GLOM|nr:3545_t:CDS:2 [Funneliformis caledonium]